MEPEELEKGRKNSYESQNEVHFADEDNFSITSQQRRSRKRSSSIPRSENESFQPSRASSVYVIGINDPGPWVLQHHRDNFITEVQKPLEFQSVFGRFGHQSQEWIGQGRKWGERMAGRKTKKTQNEEARQARQESNRGRWEDRRFRMSFAELQRMKLRKLQIKLVGKMVEMRYSNRESPDWDTTLREYVQALQDYDYMSSRSKEPADPFLVTGERWVDHKILQRAMEPLRDYFVGESFELDDAIGGWMGKEDSSPIGGTRNENVKESEWKHFRRRLEMATIGGIFLLVPMWLMVLHRTKYTALISTTVFVAFFGLIMARFLDREMDVLSSTAAYAAVLVVFVGLNT